MLGRSDEFDHQTIGSVIKHVFEPPLRCVWLDVVCRPQTTGAFDGVRNGSTHFLMGMMCRGLEGQMHVRAISICAGAENACTSDSEALTGLSTSKQPAIEYVDKMSRCING